MLIVKLHVLLSPFTEGNTGVWGRGVQTAFVVKLLRILLPTF